MSYLTDWCELVTKLAKKTDGALWRFPESLELEPFLALEPPMSATDYGFCLDHDEGLSELFDFQF